MYEEIESLNLKVPRADKAALRQLAQTEREAMSVIVRRILRKELTRRGLLSPQTLQPTFESED
jgi:hypothetical protein